MTEISLPEKPLLLIVDDDPLICDTLSFSLSSLFEVVTSHSRPHCLQLLRQLRRPPELALVDLGLPPLPHRPDEGFALISELLKIAPGDAHRRPLRTKRGRQCAPRAHARRCRFRRQAVQPRRSAAGSPGRAGLSRPRRKTQPPGEAASPLIGNSPAIEKLRLQLRQYADLPFAVLIEGESGSGKEIIASACLHYDTRAARSRFWR
jgi:DNA-binding NtrC family response regulator